MIFITGTGRGRGTRVLRPFAALLLCLLAFPLNSADCTHDIAGYYPSWTRWDPFLPADIDWASVTIVNHAFLQVLSDGTLQEDADFAFTRPLLIQEAHDHDTLALASLGGWTGCTGRNLQAIAADPARRSQFVQNLVDYCIAAGYDGATLDWEFPGSLYGPEPACENQGKNFIQCQLDRSTFLSLVQEIRAAFDAVVPPLVLSAAVPATAWYGECFDGPGIRGSFDHLEIMAYDFHGDWEGHVGHNAQLFEPPDDDFHGGVLSATGAVNYWITAQQIPPAKILLGMPFYGYLYPRAEILYDTDIGGAAPVTYADLLENYIGLGWSRQWDTDGLVPYLQNDIGPGVVCYDDPQSLAAKVTWGANQGLGGFMIWELSQDYLQATSEHPLQAAIGDLLCRQTEDDCENTLDDDGDTLTDCDDPDCDDHLPCCLLDPDRDCDGDGLANSLDCAPDDGGSRTVPSDAGPLVLTRPAGGDAELTWPDQAATAGGSTVYDLLSGILSELDAVFTGALCLSDNQAGTTRSDARSPGPGDGFWYLIRGQNLCGEQALDRPPLEGAAVCD